MKKIRYAVIGINGIGKWHSLIAKNNKNTDLIALVDMGKVPTLSLN